jgi:hypothetical protein
LGLVLAGGCARHCVDTNAYLGNLPFPEPYADVPVYVESAVGEGQPVLLAREVARAISQELVRQGYVVVDDPAAADYVFACSFGMDQGHTVVQTVPRTSRYHVTSYGYGMRGRVRSIHTHGTRTTYAEESYREYEHHLLATFIDRRRFDEATEQNREQAVVWQASAVSSGTSRDLRSIVRYLLAAVFEHFGEDTGKQRRHTFSPGSDRVERFDLHAG